MTKKLWRGDAPEVAQVTRITPVNVQIGNQFSVLINGKPITVTAVTASASAVCTLLAAAIAASPSPEFGEFDAVVDGGSLVLTAATAGVPFTVTAGAGNGTVVIDRIQAGYAGANAVQVVAVPVTLQGTWTITWDDETTSALASGASAGTVETALQALAAIGASNCTVGRATSSDGNDYLYTLTFAAALAAMPIAPVVVEAAMSAPYVRRTQLGSATGAFKNDIQQITLSPTSQYFTITKDAQTTALVSVATTAAALATIIEALSTVTDVAVSIAGDIITVEFETTEGNAAQSLMTVSVWKDSGGTNTGQSFAKTLADPTVSEVGVASQNETQTVTLVGSPTGGTFTLTYGANTTAGLAYNASAGTIQTALQGLASVGVGNMLVTGSAGGPYTVTAAGSLAASPLSLITATSSLTGGVTDSVSILTTTDSGGPNHYDDSRNWSPAGVPVNGDDVVFDGGGADCLYGLDQSAIVLDSLTIAMSWQNRKLGLPDYNSSGYQEYRPKRLAIGSDVITVGTGVGTGPSRILLDTGTEPTAIEVINTGSSIDINAAFDWIGSDVLNTITIRGGSVGVASFGESVAVVDQIIIYGGSTVLRNTTIQTSLQCNGSTLRAYDCTLSGAVLSI